MAGEEAGLTARPRQWLTWLPLGAYLGLHLLALGSPAALWGADVLVYYGGGVTALFVAVPLLIAALPPRPMPAGLRRAAEAVARIPWLAPVLWVASVPLLYLARDRSHTLGDSAKWFAVVQNAVTNYRPFHEMAWHNASLDWPGLEFVNFQQALDLVVHVGALTLGQHLFGWSAGDAYEWVSVVAGGLYLATLWALAGRLSDTAPLRVALLVFLAGLGTAQLFCGYGESYTLVTLLTAVYLCTALDTLRGRRPLWLPAVVLAVAVATHMLALSLIPSWLYLAWRHPRLGPWLRQRRVHVPASVVVALVAVVAYDQLYRDLHLPLFVADAAGRYPLLSLSHLGTLGNELLLIGPFGLVWGVVALARRVPGSPTRALLGLAALGAAGLVGVHDTTMGGRDWDLMSFPGLLVSVWGVVCLRDLVGAGSARLLGRGVLPVLVLHTALWVGVNASEARAEARLEHLLRGTVNQARHYQAWALGYYYLVLADSTRVADAETAFAEAVDTAPRDQLDTPGTRPFSYRKFHASTLTRVGREDEALAAIREVYRLQAEPYMGRDDIGAHWNWGTITRRAGDRAATAGDSTTARALWEESRVAFGRLVDWEGEPRTHRRLAQILQRLGRHEEAIDHFAQGVLPDEEPLAMIFERGDEYLASGHPELAARCYAQPLSVASLLSAAQLLHVGNRLHKAGDLVRSSRAFELALAADPSMDEALINLGWNAYLAGDARAAVAHWRRAFAVDPRAISLYSLALAHLAAGNIDSAAANYRRAIDLFGAEAGVAAAAPDNLDHLIDQSPYADAARRIRQRYWPLD